MEGVAVAVGTIDGRGVVVEPVLANPYKRKSFASSATKATSFRSLCTCIASETRIHTRKRLIRVDQDNSPREGLGANDVVFAGAKTKEGGIEDDSS